jgi:Protein of unknown function (DUF1286).
MKLRTHYIFSSGLLSLITVFFIPFLYAVFLAGLISFIGNSFIDYFGHEIKGKYLSRSPRTHTVYRSILWGLLLSLPIGVLYFVFPSFLFVFSVILDGLLVGPSHMILDVFTERGIYHKVNGQWRRIAFAHFSYNNPLANGLVILLGILMLFAAMELHTYHYYYHYYHYYNYYS